MQPTGAKLDPSQAEAPERPGWVSQQVSLLLAAWQRGESISAREIIDAHPEIDTEAAIRLIYEEACLRREAGSEVNTAEIVRQYPRWGEELRGLFECDRLLRPDEPASRFPELGETLGPFHLLSELGRGASGRIFLATDPTLADRPVVLKVIPSDQEEHLALAQLRHTHIVPLFSEHHFPERGLRVLCMPHLGGATWAQILSELVAVDHHQRTGRLLVGLIDQHTSATAAAMPWDGPFRRSLEQASYVQSIAWIGACLAEALHYAHARRLVHMDIKPSNVLITSDGQPMLLDFHLARAPLLRGGFVTDRLGGTPGWMSPEQEAAFDAVLSLQPLPADVDGRSDIYALGRLLAQALGREVRNRRGRLKVDYGARLSAGMIDIIEKCLAIDPRDRFADASQLADDLRRELSDQPLRGVRNRSVRERLRKWRRRNPAALAWAVAAAVGVIAFLGGAASLAALHQQRVAQIQTALDDGRRALILGEYDEALDVLTRAWGASGRVPFVGEQRAALRQDILRAERGRLAVELHAVADRIRFQHADELPTGAAASALSRLCETIWLRRERLLGEPAGGFDERVRTDLLEVAVVWADLCSGPIPNTGLRVPSPEAMRILDEAEASYGPSFAIDLRRSALNATDLFEPLRRPSSSWQHYDLGRALLRAGRPETAIVEFESALQSEPQDFWSQFYQGLCAFRLKRFDEAAAAFRTCVALKPQSSICHYNRAMAEESLGRDEQAEREYTQCLKLDSKRAEAYLNRGILSHKHNRIDDAISDYDKGLFVTSTAETRGLLHYNLARAMRDKGAFPEALKHAEEALRLGCEPARALRKELR